MRFTQLELEWLWRLAKEIFVVSGVRLLVVVKYLLKEIDQNAFACVVCECLSLRKNLLH